MDKRKNIGMTDDELDAINEAIAREQEQELDVRKREIELEEADRDVERHARDDIPPSQKRRMDERYMKELGLE